MLLLFYKKAENVSLTNYKCMSGLIMLLSCCYLAEKQAYFSAKTLYAQSVYDIIARNMALKYAVKDLKGVSGTT